MNLSKITTKHLCAPMQTVSIATEASKPYHVAEALTANTTRILGGFFVSVKSAITMAFTPVFSICREGDEYNTRKGNKSAPSTCGVSNLLAPITVESNRNDIDRHVETIQMNTQSPIVGAFERKANITLNLPSNSFIKSFIAAYNGSAWHLLVDTIKGQTSPIKNPQTGFIAEFSTLDQIAHWLAAQGVPEMNVFLSNVGGNE